MLALAAVLWLLSMVASVVRGRHTARQAWQHVAPRLVLTAITIVFFYYPTLVNTLLVRSTSGFLQDVV
jgi:hypothetical protein